MQLISKHVCALAVIATIASSSPMFAESAPPAGEIAPKIAPKPLTGKERLGEKWKDEQRIDNCNVPVDKRGTKPRPEACPSS
jgi:hypothetical protein